MEIIDLQPVKRSTGEIVYQQLEEIIKKIGIPRAIISDKGSDLKKGIRLFNEKHSETVHIYDLKHKIAIFVKNILESDTQWSEFKKESNYLVKKLHNTTLAGYRPPNQRDKARYMNIKELVNWAQQIIIKYNMLKNKENKTEDEIKLQAILEDILQFEDDIKGWSEMVYITAEIERFMNIHNLQEDSYEKFHELHRNKLNSLKTEVAKKLSLQILYFIKDQQKVCKPNERLLHSTEILESLFGKLKFLEKEQSHSSFTSLILSMGAMVSKTTDSIIKMALEKTNISMIDNWVKEKLGTTIRGQRKALYSLEEPEELKQKKDIISDLNAA